jgi:5-methylcytosine-specific restriction endonuclease McrA
VDAIREFKLEHLGEPCFYCERRPGTDAHHIRYRSQGGHDEEQNLALLCRHCHRDVHEGRLKL